MFAAVLANETGSYGYADLDAIARNAILQCRDMYLRPEYYAEKENAVIVLISAWMPAPPLESLPAIVNAVNIKSFFCINFV